MKKILLETLLLLYLLKTANSTFQLSNIIAQPYHNQNRILNTQCPNISCKQQDSNILITNCKCCYKHCTSCSEEGNGKCLTCINGYELNDGFCWKKCNTGKNLDRIFNICHECDSSCIQCNLLNVCISGCYDSAYMKNGKCVDCYNQKNFFVTGSNDLKKCIDCSDELYSRRSECGFVKGKKKTISSKLDSTTKLPSFSIRIDIFESEFKNFDSQEKNQAYRRDRFLSHTRWNRNFEFRVEQKNSKTGKIEIMNNIEKILDYNFLAKQDGFLEVNVNMKYLFNQTQQIFLVVKEKVIFDELSKNNYRLFNTIYKEDTELEIKENFYKKEPKKEKQIFKTGSKAGQKVAEFMEGPVNVAKTPTKGASMIGFILGLFTGFLFPALLTLFLKFFQSMDYIANLGMLNIEYGAPVVLLFDFLGSINFLPDLNSNTFIKNEELYLKNFFYTRGTVTEKMEGGFVLSTQVLNCILFFVIIFLILGLLVDFFDYDDYFQNF